MATTQDKKQQPAKQPGLGVHFLRDGAARAQALNQQPDSIPGMFKPGEFVLPPDTVHAVGGVHRLKKMVDATHTPVPEEAGAPRGVPPQFRPELFFANGGLVDEEEKRPNSFGDAAAASRNPGVTQVGAAPVGPQPAASTAPTPAAQPALGQMHNPSPRTGAQMLASGLDSGARAFFDSFGPSPEKPATTVAPTTPNPTDQRLAAGTQTAPVGLAAAATSPAATPASPAATALQTMPGVYQHGRGQFSDSAEGMGFKPGFTGQPSAQNLGAAEKLGVSGLRSGMAPAASAAPGLGVGPVLARVQAPNIQHSGNSWQAANDLRNARVSASSITANGGRFDQTRKGQISPQAATYAAMLGTDQALRQAQPGADVAAMRENAGLQREGMQQDGATQRAGMGFQTAQQRLAMDQETQGFANRAAQQSEQLRNTLLDPNATPEQRKQAQEALMTLQGKTANGEWGVQVTPAIKNVDGSTSAGSIVRYNKATGQTEVVPQPGQGQGGAAPIGENAQAIAIRDNPSLSREQKVEALRRLGYS